ncbi:MAG: type II toxin-antitoxin system PemK/MazF family toxin [Polyangiaceae bacterium]|nr:type II toxin-antitoxin system PemK/MazF family toxin [Polyangiaceae bacterium]
MRRGELYRVRRPPGDPKPTRVFVVVSRQAVVDSRYSTVICAPVFTRRDGLSTEVEVGPDEGLKHPCSIHCDALVSIPKASLHDYVGSLSATQQERLSGALRIALGVE